MLQTETDNRWPGSAPDTVAPHLFLHIDPEVGAATWLLRRWGVACAQRVLALVTPDQSADCDEAVALTEAYLAGRIPSAEWASTAFLRMSWVFLLEKQKTAPRRDLASYYATLAVNAACVVLDPYKAANFALAAVVAGAQRDGRPEQAAREAEAAWQVEQLLKYAAAG